MLLSLHIRDLALVEDAEVRFDEGLNAISGETGGGKSLLVSALRLLRGEKASAGLVRHGADELSVAGEFALGDGERSAGVTRAVRELSGVEPDDGVLIVTRIVDKKGRSRARINGRPATLSTLRTLGGWLLEIHGQGESRTLMRPEIQAETLDTFAGTSPLRGEFATALARGRRAADALADAAGSERERLAQLEYLRFQLREMEDLHLEPGELSRLEDEHKLLAHLDRMRELLSAVVDALQDAEPSASELLARANRHLENASAIDSGLAPAVEALTEASIQVDEACRAVQTGLARLDLDPSRLAEIDDRLAAVRRSLSRFGPREADFFARLDQVRAELAEMDDESAGPQALQQKLDDALAAAADLGRRLIRARRKAGPEFCRAIEAELADLGMAKTRFRVAISEAANADTLLDASTAHGPGALEFEVRINAGEPWQSMRATASGGEQARIVLAVKKCLADRDRVPFLAFDEVDAEIGGRLGLAVGAKLRDVAQHHQILIVTHLPQVAAFAAAHFKVEKRETDKRTISTIRRLERDAIERELAAMSVGEGADAGAIREARRLVERARGSSDQC